jgi:hypothetical protein
VGRQAVVACWSRARESAAAQDPGPLAPPQAPESTRAATSTAHPTATLRLTFGGLLSSRSPSGARHPPISLPPKVMRRIPATSRLKPTSTLIRMSRANSSAVPRSQLHRVGGGWGRGCAVG